MHSLYFGKRVGAFPGGLAVKNLPEMQETGFNPWVWKIPWRGAQQSTPLFLPGESMDGGAWQATVYRVTKSQTLKKLTRQAGGFLVLSWWVY